MSRSPLQTPATAETTDLERLRRRLLRKHQQEAVDEVVGEALLRAELATRAIFKPRAWLLRVAINIIREQRRRDAVRAPDAIHGVPLDDAPSLSLNADQEHSLLLKQIVLSLPPKLQEVFVLSRFEGLTNQEIATRCGISLKTVEWRMTKALAHCAAKLRD